MLAAKALASLHICAVSPEHSLLANVISINTKSESSRFVRFTFHLMKVFQNLTGMGSLRKK